MASTWRCDAGKPLRFVVAHEHRLRPGGSGASAKAATKTSSPGHEVRRFAHLGGGRCTEQELQSLGSTLGPPRAISGHNEKTALLNPILRPFTPAALGCGRRGGLIRRDSHGLTHGQVKPRTAHIEDVEVCRGPAQLQPFAAFAFRPGGDVRHAPEPDDVAARKDAVPVASNATEFTSPACPAKTRSSSPFARPRVRGERRPAFPSRMNRPSARTQRCSGTGGGERIQVHPSRRRIKGPEHTVAHATRSSPVAGENCRLLTAAGVQLKRTQQLSVRGVHRRTTPSEPRRPASSIGRHGHGGDPQARTAESTKSACRWRHPTGEPCHPGRRWPRAVLGRKDRGGQPTGVPRARVRSLRFGISRVGRKKRARRSRENPRAVGRERGDFVLAISRQRANLLGVGAVPDARERFVATGDHIPSIGEKPTPRVAPAVWPAKVRQVVPTCPSFTRTRLSGCA